MGQQEWLEAQAAEPTQAITLRCVNFSLLGRLSSVTINKTPSGGRSDRFAHAPRIRRMLRVGFAVLYIPMGVSAGQQAAPAVQWVGQFDTGLAPWIEVLIKPDLPRNTFSARKWDGVAAVEIVSHASMSLLARTHTVDLLTTPMLCWQWRIDATLRNADMTKKSGDDYAARLYVSLSIPDSQMSFGVRTKLRVARALWGPQVPDAAINYVWDNLRPVGYEMPNAYTDRTMMVVLRSGDQDSRRWVWERRNVAQDAARLFSPQANMVQLAIAADTDNTGEQARAGFANIHFVGPDQPCQAQQP